MWQATFVQLPDRSRCLFVGCVLPLVGILMGKTWPENSYPLYNAKLCLSDEIWPFA